MSRVTIGMPVYNGERFLRGALDSLLAQDFSQFDLVISDNASTDGTQAICEEYASQDSRIRYIRQTTHSSVHANFFAVLQEARTPYFMWAAHDDLWEPTFLRILVATLEEDEGALLACCDYDVYLHSLSSRVVHHPVEELPQLKRGQGKAAALRQLLRFPNPAFVYGVFKTEALRRTRTINHLQFDWSDLAIVSEISLLGRVALVPRVLFHTGIEGVAREPYSVHNRRLGFFRLSYGPYFRRTLTMIAQAPELTLRDRALLTFTLSRQVLGFIRLHEWEARRARRKLRPAPALSREPISFATGGNGVTALASGWGESEPWGTWTVGGEAVLHLTAPGATRDAGMHLALDYQTIPSPDGRPLIVDCVIRETLVEQWRFDQSNHAGRVFIAISPDLLQSESVDLAFRVHDPRSPVEQGLGDDSRRIGLGAKQICIVDSRRASVEAT